MCALKLRHKIELSRCRFFVVPGDNLVLIGVPDIESFDILKIACDLVRDQQADRKFNSQTQPSNGPSCKAHKGQEIKTDKVRVNDAD